MFRWLAIFALITCSCSPVIGNLRVGSSGNHLTVLRESSFEDFHFNYVVLKVSNHSDEQISNLVTCRFSTVDGRSEESTARVTLEPWQFEEVYFSAPITSQFRIRVDCSSQSI